MTTPDIAQEVERRLAAYDEMLTALRFARALMWERGCGVSVDFERIDAAIRKAEGRDA